MNERVAQFGDAESGMLVGVETLPVGGATDPPRPAIILLNAGVVPRVGPHRLTVRLARVLARAGFHVLRFDLAGLGDSEPRPVGAPNPIVGEIRAAMDHLERVAGVDRFVLAGLCSGADNSLKTAVQDSRVSGIILLDAYAYPTPRFYWLKIRSHLTDWRAWQRLAERSARTAIQQGRSRLAALTDSDESLRSEARRLNVRRVPPKREFADQLRRVADRGARIYIIYTVAANSYSYAGQFEEGFRRFGLGGRVRCEYWPEVNHTFTELEMQERLFSALSGWVLQHWG